MSPRRSNPKSPAFMKHSDHRKLWRMVEGAVADAFNCHPDYLSNKGMKSAVPSITKRVVGALVGHAKEAQKRGSLGASLGREGHTPARIGSVGVVSARRCRFPALYDVLCGGEQK